DHQRNVRGERIQHLPACGTRRHVVPVAEAGERIVPSLRQLPFGPLAVDLRGLGMLFAVAADHLVVLAFQRGAALAVASEELPYVVVDHELLVGVESESLLHQTGLRLPERGAVRIGGAGLVRRAESYDCPDTDQ